MNEAFEVRGSVCKLEQRKQRKQDPDDPLCCTQDLHTYDVEFSPSGKVLLETSYTHSGLVHRRIRFDYDAIRIKILRSFVYAAANQDIYCVRQIMSE